MESSVPDRLAALERRLATLEYIEAIRRVQYAYGYFIDKWLYDEALACFAVEGEFHFLNGIFRGRDRSLRRLYCEFFRQNWGAYAPPIRGALVDHSMMQDIITVDASGVTAKGRFRFLEFVGVHVSNHETRIVPPDQPWNEPGASRQWLGGALYENHYIKEDGVWKIARLTYNVAWNVPWEKGWAHGETRLPLFEKLYPDDPYGPDEFRPTPPVCWPENSLTPFHFLHPVTGRPIPFKSH